MSGLESGLGRRFVLREREAVDNQIEAGTDIVGRIEPIEKRTELINQFDADAKGSEKEDAIEAFSHAEALYAAGNDEQALHQYFKFLKSAEYDGPRLFVCNKNIGNILVRAGDFDAAEEFYNRAFTLNPDSDVLLVNLGTLEMQKGNFERARERYRMAVQINRDNAKAWVGLALAHREYGDIELAWGNLTMSLDISPGLETALDLIYQWGVKDSKFDEMIFRLQTANTTAELTEQLKDKVKLMLARAQFMVGRYRAAKDTLSTCHKIMESDEAKRLAEAVAQQLKTQEMGGN